MRTTPAFELVFLVPLETRLGVHVDSMDLCSRFDERKIETVTVVRGHDCGLGVSDMFKPFAYHRGLCGIL